MNIDFSANANKKTTKRSANDNMKYHAPYVMRVDIKQPIRVYVQKIRSVGGVQVPPGTETEKNANMGDVCFWLRDGSFEIALDRFNHEMRGRVECEKGYKIIPKGSTIWQVLSWDDENLTYFPFEVFGTFYTQKDAVMAATDEYNYDRNKLAVDNAVSMEKIGLPEAAFVDFTEPQTFSKFI